MLRTLATTNSAMMPIGTFTRNTQRQPVTPRMLSCPARKPPISGPATLEVAKVASM